MTDKRLSVNINEHTQAELRHLVDRDGITLTEAVRRLIGYGAEVDKAIRDQRRRVVVTGGGRRNHELILLDGGAM